MSRVLVNYINMTMSYLVKNGIQLLDERLRVGLSSVLPDFSRENDQLQKYWFEIKKDRTIKFCKIGIISRSVYVILNLITPHVS